MESSTLKPIDEFELLADVAMSVAINFQTVDNRVGRGSAKIHLGG
jgi:hypothetical protein